MRTIFSFFLRLAVELLMRVGMVIVVTVTVPVLYLALIGIVLFGGDVNMLANKIKQ